MIDCRQLRAALQCALVDAGEYHSEGCCDSLSIAFAPAVIVPNLFQVRE
jgi:hypothetical protein